MLLFYLRNFLSIYLYFYWSKMFDTPTHARPFPTVFSHVPSLTFYQGTCRKSYASLTSPLETFRKMSELQCMSESSFSDSWWTECSHCSLLMILNRTHYIHLHLSVCWDYPHTVWFLCVSRSSTCDSLPLRRLLAACPSPASSRRGPFHRLSSCL